MSTEFLEWISSEVGKAALQIYIDKEKTTLVSNVELNQLKFVEEVFSVVKNKDITLNNAINVLSDKFPFFKAVNTGLKIGTVAQDIAIFFFNMKTPVLHRQIYLPFESEILPKNGSTVDIGTEFSIDFSTEIELTTDNSKKIKIVEHNSNNVIKEISLNQLTIDNTIKKLLFTPIGLNLNTQYYITIPEGLVFNNTGATFQGIFTNDIWNFTTSSVVNENIYNGNITLTTQQEIDDFGANNYTQINGGLKIINSGVSITNITPLSSITSIVGDFDIQNNTNLSNLNGLGNITSIGGYLHIINNVNLANLEGLSSITSIGSDINNSNLTNLNGLSNIISINGYLQIHNNPKLTNLEGLSSITSVGGYIHIYFNFNLTNLDGLSSITSIGAYLDITSNSNLTNLDGLSNITSVNSYLQIANNSKLTNLNGLGNITSVSGYLHISNNSKLTNLEGINNITSVSSYLQIANNSKLTNLDGLSKIKSVGGFLNITNNSDLINLDGLSNITSVDGNLYIKKNYNLTNLCGIKILVSDGVISNSEYKISENAYNPTYEQIQNNGNGGCEQ
ncbi:MAG: Ig-like domain-containing protein [Cellulophaga sp.]